MRGYGKVYSTFWSSDDTRLLSDDGKVLALYLLTGPHTNMIGCFRLPDAYVSEDLGWSAERVSKGFSELLQNGFATRNERSRWILIHKFLRWNAIENPNQAKAARKAAEQVPENSGIRDLLAAALREFCQYSDGLMANPSERVSQTVSKPETETETETETENPSDSSSASPDDHAPPGETGNVVSLASRDDIPYLGFVSVFNQVCGETFPQVVKLTDKRRKRIRTLWKTNTRTEKENQRTDNLDYWRRYFSHCLTVAFFTAERTGTSHDNWRPDFDFLISERGYVGVLEGKYV